MITRRTAVLTVTFVVVVLLVTGTSIVKTALADPNSNGGATWRSPGQDDPHRNPSGGATQPGLNGGHGSPGQCQKAYDDHIGCH